ncbi:MAG: hypothetical protein ACXWC4_13575 [Telluria sp.]
MDRSHGRTIARYQYLLNVIPAKAGIHAEPAGSRLIAPPIEGSMGPRLRGDDGFTATGRFKLGRSPRMQPIESVLESPLPVFKKQVVVAGLTPNAPLQDK